MEKNRKELKVFSIFILAIVALGVIRAIVSLCVNGLPTIKDIPDGMTAEMVQVVSVIAFVVGFIIYIPRIYIGIKGIKISNGEESGKAPIVWAVILSVLAIITLVSGIADISKAFSIGALINLLGPAAELTLFVFYIVFARRIANEI